MSGDDDLTEAVEEAQVHGAQVAVMAVPNSAGNPHGVSRYLVRATDELTQLAAEGIDASVTKVDLIRRPTISTPQEIDPNLSPGKGSEAVPSTAPSPKDVALRARLRRSTNRLFRRTQVRPARRRRCSPPTMRKGLTRGSMPSSATS
ncbi:NYN domain-containing protein [Occultella aeris]|uniref:hypothetical protein n=1 Tax=Occultella aeris TaxID=2761496 RepID=UPI0018D40F77